jgi:dipeptidyl aminopeptidase/acylaminoacyl peptidase
MMQRAIIWMLVLFFSFSLQAQKRAFTLDDYYKIKSVKDPQFSPDGKQVAFYVTEYNLHEGESKSEIYIINSDGSNLRQMTYTTKSDYQARWSPDGKSLLFLSTRENGTQVWMMPVDGGEPHQLTDISTSVEDFRCTPDGKHFLFSSQVFPECGDSDDCNKKIDDNTSEGPVHAHMADHLLYRHWNFWKDGKRTHTFIYDIDQKSYLDLTPGDYDSPTFTLGGGRGYVISPDGKEVCYVSNHDVNEYETTNKDLWLVPAGGGEAVNITDENEAYDSEPTYSPDGRYIAYAMQKIPTYESDLIRLAVYDRQTKQKTVLTEGFDNWVNQFKWAPDSRSIYFLADVQGNLPLYNIDIRTKQIKQVIEAETIDYFTLSPDGKTIIICRRSVGEPHELWRLDADGKNLKRITFFNEQLEKEVDFRPAEQMWIPSPTGKKIHTFVVKPHNFDPNKKYPLILNVHGGPQSQWTDGLRGDWQVYPGSGYVVAFPNPHGSTGYGQEFTAEISEDWGGKVYQDVMAVTDSLAKIPWIDEKRMGAMGWSYGGYMMMWLEGHTDRFKAIASMMGVYNLTSFYGTTEELWFPQWDLGGTPWDSDLYQKWSPHLFVKNFKTPCLVITGEKDFRVNFTESLQFFTDLQKMGVPSRLIVFENDGHWPSFVKSMPLYYNAHLDWFHKYLGGEPAPYDVQDMVRNQAFK